MGKARKAKPVKLICGILYRETDTLEAVLVKLEKLYGSVEFESEHGPFSHTTYYEKEMGDNLNRIFVSFARPIMPDMLADIKQATNKLEQSLTNETGGRLVNIDPGYVSLANLVLASTKDYAHRIYLRDGIFGEVTMIYEKGEFRSLKWTYPDYQGGKAVSFLLRVREALKESVLDLKRREK